ncbi:MAG: ABC transporter substrate-binding protein [Eubacteriales bacterium]
MKKLLVLVLAVALVFSFAACQEKAETTEPDSPDTDVVTDEPAVVEEAETIKIGLLAPLSGDGAVHGVPVKNAGELAAAEINAAGGIDGKMIEIVAYDTKGDGPEAVNAYNKLKDQDEVVAIVGGTYSGATLAFIDLAVADNMPILSPTATNPDVTLAGPNVFRACYTDAYQGVVAGAFAVDTLGAKMPAVLYDKGNAYSDGLAVEYIAACEAAGLEVIVETYALGDADFSAQLTNIVEAGADALFIPDYANTVGPILTQLAAMDAEIPCLGGDGWDGIINDYAAESEGFYFANHYATDDESEIVQNFIAAYEAEYGETPNALGALAYDAVYIMAAAIDAADSTDSAAIVAELAKTDKDGVTGHVTFDENGDPQKSVSMIQVVDGAYTLFKKVTP